MNQTYFATFERFNVGLKFANSANMTTTVSAAELLQRGLAIEPQEAVAIAQALAASAGQVHQPDGEPLPSPTLDTVHLAADGTVTCTGSGGATTVSDVAAILHAMLASTPKVPGALRYAIARGLGEVDAPAFASLEDFSRTLSRFEQGDRPTALRSLMDRYAAVSAESRPSAIEQGPSPADADPLADASQQLALSPTVVVRLDRPPPELLVRTASLRPERRRAGSHVAALRRRLREADQLLFEQQVALSKIGRIVKMPALSLVSSSNASQEIPDDSEHPAVEQIPATTPIAVDEASARTIETEVEAAIPAPQEARPARTDRTWRPLAPAIAVAAALVVAAGSGFFFVRDVVLPKLAPAAAVTTSSPPPASRGVPDLRADVHKVEPERGVTISALDLQRRPVFSPAFAANESTIFFHTGRDGDGRSALAMATPADGAGNVRVTTILDDGARNYHVQPSSDGRLIAFDSDRDGERGVYIANRDGTDVRRVSGSGYAAVPSWSPDGKRLAYVRAEPNNPKVWNLWLLTLGSDKDGSGSKPAERLTRYRIGQPWAASWFNDGRRICYAHEDKLIILDLVTGRRREFDSPVKGRLLRTPAVSPDGSKVVFQVFRRGAWMLDVASGSMRRVLSDPSAEEFAWAPDGRRIAFHSRRGGQWAIYVYREN